MKILLATSEAVPFAKTGGLADVTSALPAQLARMGHEPVVILPAYRHTRNSGQKIETTGIQLQVPIGNKTVQGSLLKSQLPESTVPVYLVQQDHYFDREELYTVDGKDYIDNCERFVFFCRAVVDAIRLLDLRTDLLHANDWQTGLIPAYLKTLYSSTAGYEQIATLLTIHNLAYQGKFWHWDMELTGLDWKYFNWQQMEYFGHLNLLKTGIVFSDSINTVSPRYAEEIQSAPLGCGLEGALRHRREVLSGIINGVDYNVWNPATDPYIAAHYDVSNYAEGKAVCKAALQEDLGLPQDERVPLVGFIGRLTSQKGIDLIAGMMKDTLETSNLQWVFLGTGDPKYEETLSQLAERHPKKVVARFTFSTPLAHQIEAGADMFLMPSRYEPCGLNQLYSLKYGTVPIVRVTGGLADTITDMTPETLDDATANGFCFHEYTTLAFAETLQRASNIFIQRNTWNSLVANGMHQDWSWENSAKKYVSLYEQTIRRSKETVLAY